MGLKFAYQSLLVLLLCAEKFSYGIKNYDNVKISRGTHTCISDCSQESGNRTVICEVQECGIIPRTSSGPQHPDIEGVSFEVFGDEKTGENRLALKVKWSPVDNVSLERMTGYLLNITDGESTLTRCYNIDTRLDFFKDTKLTSYNDCYGKVDTMVKLGSKITVSITGLPQDMMDMTEDYYSTSKFTVDVPDCTSEDSLIQDLGECIERRKKLGAPPTRQECAESCNTTSEMGGKVYPVECSTSKSTHNTIGKPERCVAVNKSVSGSPSQPLRVAREQEWYKFEDGNGAVEVALNFSWTPAHDASIGSLKGYYMEILDTGKAGTGGYNKCFSIHTTLEEDKHSAAEFFYDCYGREPLSIVEPGHEYLIHMASRPDSPDGTFLKFYISVPNCVDPSMQDVTECITENGKRLEGEVEEIFCQNRSLKYRYYVSEEYGDRATVAFCERGPNLQYCKNGIVISEDMARGNVLYNISLPSAANLSIPYSIYVHGNDYPGERNISFPNFTHCVIPEPIRRSDSIITAILVVGILLLLGVIFMIWFCYRDHLSAGILKKFRRRGGAPVTQNGGPIVALQGDPPILPVVPESIPPDLEPPVLPSKLRVYVIFMDDHEFHIDVVHWFCSYLKADLSLDVRMCMWENTRAAANPTMYMTENLKLADKVIIICSAGTKNCLDRPWQGDMFTPVVRNIISDSFVGKNPGKFLVGYFPYSKPTDVPEYLYDQTMMYFSLFKLMKQFEQFYFRLVGIEQYQEGGIQRIEKIAFDRYYDPRLTTCGKKLKETIESMSEFAKDNPNWYTDIHGSDLPGVNLPPSPGQVKKSTVTNKNEVAETRPKREASHGMDQVVEGMASINLLHLSHPPELPADNGARRKKTNAPERTYLEIQSQRPNAVQLQNEVRVPPPSRPNGVRMQNGMWNEMHMPSYSVQPKSALSQSSAEDDESFMIPETEVEDLSSYSTRNSSRPPHEHDDLSTSDVHFRPATADHGSFPYDTEESNFSFSPSSFGNDDDINRQADLDSSLLTDMPSNETQITRLGYPGEVSMPRIPEAEILISRGETDEDRREKQEAQESGVFMLASVDDVSGDSDVEEEFKSINQLV